MGKYLMLSMLPYSNDPPADQEFGGWTVSPANTAITDTTMSAALSVILMVKLSEDPFTVAETTPVLESPFLSITTVVPPFVVPSAPEPGRLLPLPPPELEPPPVPLPLPLPQSLAVNQPWTRPVRFAQSFTGHRLQQYRFGQHRLRQPDGYLYRQSQSSHTVHKDYTDFPSHP